MRKKNLAVMVCCVVLGLGLCATAYGAEKVGYINLQRLVNESAMGKAAKDDIRKMRQEKEAVLRRKLNAFNSLKALINEEGDDMSPAEKRGKIEELREISKEYQRLLADSREDLVREDRQVVSIILEKADGVLKKVAKKNNFSIIIKDPNAIGYLDPKVDITDAVLKELNK